MTKYVKEDGVDIWETAAMHEIVSTIRTCIREYRFSHFLSTFGLHLFTTCKYSRVWKDNTITGIVIKSGSVSVEIELFQDGLHFTVWVGSFGDYSYEKDKRRDLIPELKTRLERLRNGINLYF